MALKVRTGGAWRDAPALGAVATVPNPVGIRVRTGGAWRNAQRVKIKSGGNWVDSGYFGPPWIPQSPTNMGVPVVNWWNYSQVNFGWWGPAGGPPPVTYQLVLTDASGNWLVNVEDATGARTFNVSEDTQYQFYVRSKNAFGDYSVWLGPLKIGIGHAQQMGWVTTNHADAWHAERSLYLWQNQMATIIVPSDVAVSSMNWNMSATNGNWSYCSEPSVAGNNYNWRHQIRPIKADYWDSATESTTMWIANPEASSMGMGGQNGGGKNWGFIALGYKTNPGAAPTDWTQFGFMPEASGYPGCPDSVSGGMSIDGTRYWSDSQYVVTRTEQANGYWGPH